MEELYIKLVAWLKEYAKKANVKGAVFGMSGGLDSAVVSVLCKKAYGDNALGLNMPCYSEVTDELDAKLVAEKFDIRYKTIIWIVYLMSF